MVHIDERNAQRPRKTLRETHTDEQRTHQSGTACEGDGRKLFLRDTCLPNGLADDRHDVLLMGA